MKRGTTLASAIAVVLTATVASAQTAPAMKMTTPIPAEITTPDTIESRIGTLQFNDGFPTSLQTSSSTATTSAPVNRSFTSSWHKRFISDGIRPPYFFFQV